MGHPDAIDQVEMLDMLGERVGNDECHVGTTTPLILTKLGQPAIAPGLRALGLPKDHAGRLANGAVDLLDDIRAQLPLGNGFDGVRWKFTAQQLLELELENL